MTDRTGEIRRVVERERGRAPQTVTPLGSGLDHSAYLVDGDLVVRFAERDEGAAAVEREARLLALVGEIAPVPVPRPVFAISGCLAYERLPGVPLIELAEGERASAARRIGEELGGLLAVLHALDAERLGDLVDADDDGIDVSLEDAREQYGAVADSLPAASRTVVERFLDSPPPAPAGAQVFSHNDLGIEHVLVDPATLAVTGVIDWSDAALTDPAYDFGLLIRDLGPEALVGALAAYGSAKEELFKRAWFYARCALLEDLAYGIESGRDEYTGKSLSGVGRLFAE